MVITCDKNLNGSFSHDGVESLVVLLVLVGGESRWSATYFPCGAFVQVVTISKGSQSN